MPDGCETDAKLITFSPAVEASVQTKSTESWPSESWNLTDEAGEYDIPLTYYSAVNTSGCFSKSGTEGDAEIETKGVKINDISGISSFFVCAYDEKSARFIPSSGNGNNFEEVTNKNGTWSADGKFEWTNNAYRTFYAYANKQAGDGIEYKSPQSSEGILFTYTVPALASSQTDFLLGYYTGTPDECEEDSGTLCKVPMSFTHAMTSIRFKQSTDLMVADGSKITDIEISGVYKSGTVKIGPGGITWSGCSTGDDFSVSESDSAGYEPDPDDGSIGESFFLIPQSEGKVTITVTIKNIADNIADNEESRKVTATLKPEWQAGHSYVYTFGEGFMPEICDDTSIKNVGNEAGYFRAAVITYTVDGSGVVVGPSTSPVINTAGGWISDGKGFYCYNSQVKRGESTTPIVTNKDAIKESDANAKLKILVQASKVPFNK